MSKTQSARDQQLSEQFRRFADLGLDWETWTRPDGTLLYCSPACERLTGYPAQAFHDAPGLFASLVLPEDLPEVREHLLEDLPEVAPPQVLTFRIRAKDGEIRHLSHSCQAIFDDNGRYLGRRGSNRDITAIKRMEENLAASEARYRAICEAVTDYVFTVHMEHSLPGRAEHTPACQAVCDHSEDEFAAAPGLWDAMVLPEDRLLVREETRQALLGSRPRVFEHRIQRQDGGIRWLRVTILPRRDPDGLLLSYETMVQDVSERKQAELDLLRYQQDLEAVIRERTRAVTLEMEAKRQAQAETEELNKRLAATLEALPDLLFELDRDGRILDYHAPEPRHLFRPPVEFLGQVAWEVLPGEAGAVFRAALERAWTQGKDSGATCLLPTPSGKRWFEISLAAKGETGDSPRFIALLHDITDRKAAEQEQSLHTLRLQALVRLNEMRDRPPTEVGQFVLQATTTLSGSDIAMLCRMSEDGEFLIPYAYSASVNTESQPPPVDKIAVRDGGWWTEVLRGKAPVVVNNAHLDQASTKGLPPWHLDLCRFVAIPVLEHERVALLGLVANKAEDYTDNDVHHLRLLFEGLWRVIQQQEAERTLRESERKYRTLFDSASDAIFILDQGGRILDTNITGHARLGYGKEELIGRHITSLVAEDFAPKTQERLSTIQTLGSHSFESAHRRKDGSIMPVEIKASSIEYAGQRAQLGIIRDITDRKQAEDALRQAKSAAEAANQAKSEFLANMSHEVRTPMTAILGMTRLALETDLTAEQRHFLDTVQVSAEGLLGLINDILDFSKIEAGQLTLHHEPFDLGRLSDEVLRLFALPARDKGLALSCRLPSDPLPPLLGDALRLRQILVNLIGNAVKFTDQGDVELAVAVLTRDNDQLTLEFTVRDSGRGIPQAFLSRIFERFSQADSSISRSHGGVGLGLAITQRLVRLMGGELSVASQLGRGAVFSFRLRLAVGDLHDLPEASAPEVATELPPQTVLLVEDNDTNRALGRILLGRLGHRVVEAENGLEAVDLFGRGGIDLILMDVQMPVMDGIAATRVIRGFEGSSGKHIPIIALTAHAMAEDRERCLAAGMDSYLTKPFDLASLSREIARCHGDAPPEHEPAERPSPPSATCHPLGRDEVAALLGERYGLGEEDVERLVRSSQESLARSLATAQAALAAGDLDEVRRAAHSMKGVLLNMGAEAAGGLAKDLEHLASGKEPGDLAGLLAELQAHLAEFLG